MGRPWPTGGCCAKKNIVNKFQSSAAYFFAARTQIHFQNFSQNAALPSSSKFRHNAALKRQNPITMVSLFPCCMLPAVHLPSNYFLHFPPFCAQPNWVGREGTDWEPTEQYTPLQLQFSPLAVPWLWRLLAGLSPWRTGFVPGLVCEIYGRQTVTGIVVSVSNPVLPCQYHSTIAPHSFIHLSLCYSIISGADTIVK